jgi:hypothetical protein
MTALGINTETATAFKKACQGVIDAAEKGLGGNGMYYAATYAKAGLELQDHAAIRVQATYILVNMHHWRGPAADRVREVFKAYGKIA